MNGRSIVRVLIGTSILVVAVWFMMRGVDLSAMFDILKHADLVIAASCIPLVIGSHLMRAIRWRTLLRPTNHVTHLSTAFNSVMIGYAANTIVPRSGELIRPWVFARREGMPVATAMSSVLVERVIDVLTLLLAIALVMVLAPGRFSEILPGFTPSMVATRLALPIGLLVVVLSLIVFTPLGIAIVHRVIRPMFSGLAEKLEKILTTVREGMSIIGQPRLYARLVLETVIIWVLYALPLWIIMQSLPFLSAHTITMVDAAIMLVIISVGVTIAPTPGALGVYQSFAQTALVVLAGATPTEGLAFGMLAWTVNYGLAFVVGAICWLIESRNGITFRSLSKDSAPI